jgi:pimeloyl-ACP methyl ester carboxylesterase
MPVNRKVQPAESEPRLRRAYFECRFGQLHVHHAIPPGGGFDEHTTLICIHARGSNGRAMLPLLASFGRSRSVYAPDMPGTGESDPMPAQETDALQAAIAAIGDFIADMRLRQVDVLGIGSGAEIARGLGVQRSGAIRRLALLGEASAGRPAAAARPTQPQLELPSGDVADLARDQKLADFLK